MKIALNVLEGMNKTEIYEQTTKKMALQMAGNFLQAFEMSGKLPESRMVILREEYKNFKAKLADEEIWFLNDEDTDVRDTTDEPGKIKDSGEEKDMKITERATKALEKLADQGEEKDLEEALLDVVDTSRSPKVSSETYHAHLDPEHPAYVKETKKNLSLNEGTVIEAVTRNTGITNENQRSENIKAFSGPEGEWTRRSLEHGEKKITKKSDAKNKTDEDEVLAALTR
jgi:hypothetical protein